MTSYTSTGSTSIGICHCDIMLRPYRIEYCTTT
jgi:hypothetical protein